MGAFMRSLKYASFRAGRVIGITAGMSVGFVFYFTFLNGESFTVENLISRFPLMLIFIANLMFLIYGMVDVASYVPLTLSYGSTRKAAFFSNLYMQALQILSVEIMLWLCFKCIPRAYFSEHTDGNLLCAVALCIFLLGCGIALPCGVLISRFGKTAYIIVVVLASVGGGMFGALIGFREMSSWLVEWLEKFINVPAIVGIGFGWYILMNVLFYLGMRKYEVRV